MSLVLKNISKIYTNSNNKSIKKVLDDISLSVEKGDMIALKGKSGAGKSTLLHIIGLLDRATEGDYLLDEVDIAKVDNKRLAALRNQKIGYILQDFGLIEEETVLYNVCLPMIIANKKMKIAKEAAIEKLKSVGMESYANNKVSNLSGGEKQRVAIARALMNDPMYILADEPTGALDSGNSEKIMKLMQRLNSEGKTIIIVTHDDTVAKMCKKTIILNDGKIVEET